MQDGPQGFRITKYTGIPGSTTAWPSALNLATSFDSDLAYRWAQGMAEEFIYKGSNVMLAPGIGVGRVPTNGRIFEYLCGEDPFLGSLLAKQVVIGIQEKGVIANAKHFVNNEIETERMSVSAAVKERVRFELYYPPFQASSMLVYCQ
jgi:beta-glucosidase